MRGYQQGQFTAAAAWGKTQTTERMLRPVKQALSDNESPFWDDDRANNMAESIKQLPGLTPAQRADALKRFAVIREERWPSA